MYHSSYNAMYANCTVHMHIVEMTMGRLTYTLAYMLLYKYLNVQHNSVIDICHDCCLLCSTSAYQPQLLGPRVSVH